MAKGFLPRELKGQLTAELDLEEEDDRFFDIGERKFEWTQEQMDEERWALAELLGEDPSEHLVLKILRLSALRTELRTFRKVVATSREFFSQSHHSETSWKEYVYGPVLSLAVK